MPPKYGPEDPLSKKIVAILNKIYFGFWLECAAETSANVLFGVLAEELLDEKEKSLLKPNKPKVSKSSLLELSHFKFLSDTKYGKVKEGMKSTKKI